MKEEAKRRMWNIDHDAQLGNDISKEDKDFFNAYYEMMLEELESDYTHFKHHASKF